MRRKPAGTGPYIFKERQLSRYVLYERAPRPTGSMVWWTGKRSQMTWTLEEPTRFAQLLAGETHLTEVNKDLTDELVAKGYKLIRSRGTAQQVQINFGGLYFGTEDPQTKRYTENGGHHAASSTNRCPGPISRCGRPSTRPLTGKNCCKVLYKGRADLMYVHGFYPDLEGWDPAGKSASRRCTATILAAAKRLLAEAGYPKGFKAKAWLFPFAGAPELIPLVEAIQIQLREVGHRAGAGGGGLGGGCPAQVA